MRIRSTGFKGRKAWELHNGALTLVLLEGGGHVASVVLKDGPQVNPLWEPAWKGLEPWDYGPQNARQLGSQLLSSICGHNLCLGWFGDPSEQELAAGMGCHGEAPVVRWKLVGKKVTAGEVSVTVGCELPVAEMRFVRTVTLRRGSSAVRFHEEVSSLSRRDMPFTMCEHVTVGPPFLENESTVFDLPAIRAHTFPDVFHATQRLKSNRTFVWPKGPGENGNAVDLRRMGPAGERSSDFSAQLIDTKNDLGWFSALNPEMGLMLAYVWARRDFPWVGSWEENRGRKQKPWDGRSLARGMEFSNTPFPQGLRKAVELSSFQGHPAYRWLPALGRIAVDYAMILRTAPAGAGGVGDIRPGGADEFTVNWLR
jgi:hypothetical protein